MWICRRNIVTSSFAGKDCYRAHPAVASETARVAERLAAVVKVALVRSLAGAAADAQSARGQFERHREHSLRSLVDDKSAALDEVALASWPITEPRPVGVDRLVSDGVRKQREDGGTHRSLVWMRSWRMRSLRRANALEQSS